MAVPLNEGCVVVHDDVDGAEDLLDEFDLCTSTRGTVLKFQYVLCVSKRRDAQATRSRQRQSPSPSASGQ